MRKMAAAAMLGTGLLAGPACADVGLELRYGERGDYSQRALGLRFGEIWSSNGDRWAASLQPVVEVGRLKYSGNRAGRDSLNYGSGGVNFRFSLPGQNLTPYFEAGLGGALLSSTTLGPKSLSTRFQFTEWVGLGIDIGQHMSVAYRFVHFSNANIKRPNDGIDMQQIVLTARF